MREIKSVNAKNVIIRKTAQECFTDRKSFSDDLKKAYAEISKNGGTCSLYFYGTGGYGKTTLLDRLMKEKYTDNEYKVKYDMNDGCSKIEILSAIWKKIKEQSNNKFIFPLFEPVLYLYSELTNKNLFDNAMGKDISLDPSKELAEHLIESIRNSNIVKDVLDVSFFFKISKDLKSIFVDISKAYKNKKLYDSNPEAYELLLKCTEKASIENNIDKLFIFDFNYNIKRNNSKPIIIFLDTLEVMIKQEYHRNVSINDIENYFIENTISFNEDWLIGNDGLIRSVEQVIWVLAGRNNIFDINDEFVYSRKLDEFNDEDSRYFLKENGIEDFELQNTIISTSKGAPIYLDMCVNIYLHKRVNNEIINPSDFRLLDANKLTKLYCDCLNKEELKILRVLSLLRKFTKDEAEHALKCVFADYVETGNSFENVLNSANIQYDEQTKDYKINDIVSIGVLNDPNFDKKLKKYYLDKLFNKFLFEHASRFTLIPDNQIDYDNYDISDSSELEDIENYSKIVDSLFFTVKNDEEYLNELSNKIVDLIMNNCAFDMTSSFPDCVLEYLKPDYLNINYLCIITYYYFREYIFNSKSELKDVLLLIINSIKKLESNKINYRIILRIIKLMLDKIVPVLYSNFKFKNNIEISGVLTIYDEIDVYNELSSELSSLINIYIDLCKRYDTINPFNEDILMMYIVLNISSLDNDTLNHLIEQYLSIISSEGSLVDYHHSLPVYNTTPETIINCLYNNSKFSQAKYLYDTLYFNDTFPKNLHIAQFKYKSFDLQYLRILNSLKEYTVLYTQSKKILEFIKTFSWQEDENPLFSDFDIFARHTYFSRSLYYIGKYDDALIESNRDVQFCEKNMKKTDKGYLYNKLLNSLCNYKLGNEDAFLIYDEIKDNCSEIFDKVDPDIKDEFLKKFSEYTIK